MTHGRIDRLSLAQDLPLILQRDFSDEEFFEFCRLNRELRIERDPDGTIHIMTPTGFDTGNFNHEIGVELGIWNRTHQAGKVGDSSTGYQLASGAVRSPDISWISNQKLSAIDPEKQKGFLPACPDFVIEICSPSDSLPKLQQKMLEYMENGCRLSWLIDREKKQVFIYRAGGAIETIAGFDKPLSGENVLPGFEIVLQNLET